MDEHGSRHSGLTIPRCGPILAARCQVPALHEGPHHAPCQLRSRQACW